MQNVCCSYTISLTHTGTHTHTHADTPPRGGVTSTAKLDFGRICWLHLNNVLLFYLFHKLWTRKKKEKKKDSVLCDY